MPQLTQAAMDRAEAIRATLANEANAIRGNADYTTDARQKYLARSFVKAQDAMTAHRRSFLGANSSDAASLRRDLFGATSTSGDDAISVRDADDRASRIESSTEAHSLLVQAEENGDEVLARAIARRAYAQAKDFWAGSGWGEVLGLYVESRPEVAAKLEQLEAATRDERNASTIFAFVVSKPNELAGMADHKIRVLAQ
jgi:hypothetical protein